MVAEQLLDKETERKLQKLPPSDTIAKMLLRYVKVDPKDLLHITIFYIKF